jgi:hypothetical protein
MNDKREMAAANSTFAKKRYLGSHENPPTHKQHS